ncbi:hypothetical protein [Thioalkalivibrio nitratireducens]|nr:hypothetical protein [Thioalkalivibrio nitratireducens]
MQAIYGNPPDRVVMEPKVHALAGLNTPFDEFNAVAIPPPLKLDTLLVFASNAATQGRRFEIETARLQLVQAPYSQRADGKAPAPRIRAERTGRFAGIPASGGNQLGPTPLSDTRVSGRIYDQPFPPHMTMSLDLEREPLPWSGRGQLPDGAVWMFDSDHAGRRNLYFVDPQGRKQAFFGNRADADDAYASYDFERHVLYFSSNRSGRYRIYRYVNSDGNTRFARWLGDPARAAAIEPVPALNAEGNTLAPFVQGGSAPVRIGSLGRLRWLRPVSGSSWAAGLGTAGKPSGIHAGRRSREHRRERVPPVAADPGPAPCGRSQGLAVLVRPARRPGWLRPLPDRAPGSAMTRIHPRPAYVSTRGLVFLEPRTESCSSRFFFLSPSCSAGWAGGGGFGCPG